jgi:RNA polymerase sigma-70 factor (ECF subfamily)
MAGRKKRFRPSRAEQERLLAGFMAALRDGDVDALRNVLASDVIAYADGGGKVAGAGRHPILGFEKVARLYFSLARQAAGLQMEVREVNGVPALVARSAESIVAIVTFVFAEDGIQQVASIVNPDKLRYALRQFATKV